MLTQPPPPSFLDLPYEFSFVVSRNQNEVWKWLNDPETFTKTQYWPFVVEFYSPDPENIPTGFYEGDLTNHYGPFINFAGKITKVTSTYRDLQYAYGSYAISFRWIRPYRLEFWTEVDEEGTKITGKISCYVKPNLRGFWLRLQKLFWKRFQQWVTKKYVK